MTASNSTSRVHPADLLRVGSIGLTMHRLRASLSALGIAIGIASMVAVLGISESSKAQLLSQLDRLGTNLLRVAPGESFFGEDSKLPVGAAKMIARMDPVQQVSSVRYLDATVRRNNLIDDGITGGIRVMAADVYLLETLEGSVADGVFFNDATSCHPA